MVESMLIGAESPSSRRAWIEIKHRYGMAADWRVVLLAEGVDRNYRVPWAVWRDMVALLAEGVDRNIPNGVITKITKGRPPRGGRG